jgi:hypothetical protein
MKYTKDFNVNFFDMSLQAKEIINVYLREY